jgi:2',3'-cyclic-nucleotide 2'-phosphodiesterase (5'-nucleotidase family)
MGYGLESSIAQSRITGYVFASPVAIIEYYAEYLRTQKGVDYVFALSHDSGNINSQVAQFTGNKKVDIIFNAHSHSRYVQTIGSTTIIQSSSNGKYVGNIRIDLTNQTISATNVRTHSSLNTPDPAVKALIDGFKAETDVLFNTPIISSARYIPSSTLSDWLADLMRKVTDADIAFHNYGGTRDSMASGESITLGKLYKIFPFDNTIKTVYLDGAVIQNFLNRSSDAYSTTVTNFVPGTLYKVATNDYIFDKTDNPFIYGSNPNFDGTLLRDMVLSELQLQKNVYASFDTTNPILSGHVPNARNRFTELTLNT